MRSIALALVLGALLPAGAASAQARVTIGLSDVPDDLTLPLPAGRNLVLTATVAGAVVRSVWLAAAQDAPGRYLLTATGPQTYQVNLADPVVARLLATGEERGSFRIFAETAAGEIHQSVVVRYRVLSPSPFSVVLRVRESKGERRLRASHAWASPDEVSALAIPLDAGMNLPVAATAGEKRWAFGPDAGHGETVLVLTPEIREAWHEKGEIIVHAGDEAGRTFRLRARPRALDLAGNEARFAVRQRESAEVPGSRGWLEVLLDDITAGQVLVEVKTAEGEAVIARRSVKQGDNFSLAVGERVYTLTLDRLVNVLIGKDFAEFVVSGVGPTERDRIGRLIARIAEAKVIFLREGEEHDAKTAASHIRQKYETAGPKVRSLDEFIDKVASRSWTTGHPYQVRLEDGRTVDAAAWLRDLARDLTPEGGEKAK